MFHCLINRHSKNSFTQRSGVTLTTLQQTTAVSVFRGNAGIFVGGLLIMINVFNVL